MRSLSAAVLALAVGVAPAAFAQAPKPVEKPKKGEKAGKGDKKSEEDFVKEKPTVGDTLPDLTVYTPDGKEVKTSDLRGHHTVLVFGCLT